MRSAPSAEAWRDPRGASTADRLVVTACRLVAEHGEDATSLRAVAQAAGCSPSLVVHHFGSRAGLLEACDRAVVALLDEALAPLLNGADPGTSSVESVAGALLAAADDDPVLAYALRSLTEGGRAGHHLFVALFEHARRLEDSLVDAGVVRPAADPEVRTVLLMALDVGMLILRSHATVALGVDEATLAHRWAAEETRLLTHGWFAGPADPTTDSPREEAS